MGTKDVSEDVLLDSALTEDELLEDISDAKQAAFAVLDERAKKYPLIQDGDLTTQDLQDRYGMSAGNAPISFMQDIVTANPEIWQMLKVVEKPGSKRWFWVLRLKRDN